MAKKSYISRIARHKIVTKPTTRNQDGTINPGRVIEFVNHRYTTEDPAEQAAIEKSLDFGRLIFHEGQAPKPLQEQKDVQLKSLQDENARLNEEISSLTQRLQQLEAAITAGQQKTAPTVKKGKASSSQAPSVTIPAGQKCEELVGGKACPDDAVAEVDGMFLCEKHAKESGKEA